MVTSEALRARYLSDARHAESAVPALARALEQIGWRSVQESSPDEVARHLVYLLDAFVHVHHDLRALKSAIAGLLRDHGPTLDGGMASEYAYLPAAEELLRLYVSPGSGASW